MLVLNEKSPPLNLEEVYYNYNDIKEIKNVKEHRFLKKLDLSNNKISQINGLFSNSNLKV